MKIKLLIPIILFATFNVLSQTNYEQGYLIKTDGNRLDCLIKNEDWKGSPATFKYKLGENGEEKLGTVSNTKEFGSDNNFKYIMATVPMEQSSDKVGFLSEDRNPVFKDETLFLKVLVEGAASLYYTLKNGDHRFFYKMDDDEITPLIYKRFKTKNLKIGENNRYKQQLATDFVCSNSKNINFDELSYKKSSLVKRFEDYNNCNHSESTIYRRKDSESKFNLTLRPGVTFGTAFIKREGKEQLDFDSQTGFRIGLEAEYVLPFNNGKWSLFIEAAYRNFKAEKEMPINEAFPTLSGNTIVTVDYNSVEMPIGGRYSMFLNNNNVIFINGAVVIDVSTLNSSISSSNDNSYDLNFTSEVAMAFGAGYKFKNKYSIEARYVLPRNIIDYVYVTATHKSFALIAGYNFL